MAHDSMVLEEGKDREPAPSSALKSGPAEVVVNASGHKQELERNFSLLSICGVGITTGNTWIAMGGSIWETRGYLQCWATPGLYMNCDCERSNILLHSLLCCAIIFLDVPIVSYVRHPDSEYGAPSVARLS
ncbi:hypothetical protein CIRG_08061 [Coccidioides immitis RMSCC 2394]|uniref:Uncharacterized protein n=1 Tax=Coccidioides immitis RMSCC 2394 TaxID=404692 RepID=A0A0J6YL18_COCIT|nr:hypothetical protein CIRG_08061 [Coccidioides immitis RMSCC 2394]